MFFRKKSDSSSPNAADERPAPAKTETAPPKAPAAQAAASTPPPAPEAKAKASQPTPPAPSARVAAKPATTNSTQPAKSANGAAVASSKSGESAPQRQESKEEREEREEKARRGAVLSKRIAAAFGEIVSVLMRSKAHKDMPLSQLQSLVPAVVTGQYVTAEAQSRENGLTSPIAILLWASVSDEVDKRLSADAEQPLRLSAAEWNGGDNIWVVEAVGDTRAISLLIKRMNDTRWKGRPVKVRARGEDGKALVKTISAAAAA